jgi:hypothetical protein
MFSGLRRSITGLVPLSLFLGAAVPALGCGFDGMLDGSFSALHPKSIAVAFAIRDAVEAGTVEKSAIDPIVPNSAGYWRAVAHLNAFQQRLSAAAAQSQPHIAMTVLFIDSNLWTRFTPAAEGFDIDVHASGALPGDVVLVTSEAILAYILDRKLLIETALNRGLIAIDGEPAPAANVLQVVAGAFVNVSPSAAQPVRFFGSVR